MQVTKKLTVDLAHKYPPEMEIKSHELNKNSLFLAISLYCYGEPVTFSNETVTAALVFKGRLISGDVSCSTSGNVITLDVSAQQLAPFLLGSGIMYVELTVTVSGSAVYVLPFRLIVNVDEAIVNNAEVTTESFGAVAETVVEVFEAIGDAESLAAVIAAKLDDADGVIQSNHIASGAITSGKIGNRAVTEDKLDSAYTGKIPTVTVWNYGTSQTNNFTVPTTFEGKLGDIVVVTTGTGTGGKIFACMKIISAYGVTQYYWEEITLFTRISALETTVGTVNFVLQSIVDGGASNE